MVNMYGLYLEQKKNNRNKFKLTPLKILQSKSNFLEIS